MIAATGRHSVASLNISNAAQYALLSRPTAIRNGGPTVDKVADRFAREESCALNLV